MIDLFIEGIPVPQGRPRFTTRGKYPRAYDPKKSRDWKEYVKGEAQRHPDCPSEPSESPLRAVFIFYLPRPKSMPKKDWGKPHVKKPDCTNLVKGIEDALEGIVYKNDSQIFDTSIIKRYAPEPSIPPGVHIVIEEV